MGAEDEGGEGMVGEDMIHTEWHPTDSANGHRRSRKVTDDFLVLHMEGNGDILLIQYLIL